MAAMTPQEKSVLKELRETPDQDTWPKFAKAAGVPTKELGPAVHNLLETGKISEPGGKGTLNYVVN